MPRSVERPHHVRREMVVAFAPSLRGDAPPAIRRKLSAVASFYAFPQYTGPVALNPARGAPLPKMTKALPACPSDEQARRLLEAAYTPWHRVMIALLLFA